MELERQENVFVVGHQVKTFHLSVSRPSHRPVTGHPPMSVRTAYGFSCDMNFPSSLPFACSYAYFHNLPQVDLPYIKIPLHTVIKLTPKAYGCDEERYVWSPRDLFCFVFE
jgi:hypothetical protein